MIRFQRLSIRNKLIAVILVATVLPLISGFAFVIVNDIRAFRRDMVESIVTVARVTGENSVSDLAFGASEDAKATLEKLSAIPNIDSAYLFDTHGALFAEYRPEPRAVKAPGAPLRRFEVGKLIVAEPIVYHGDRYGTICLVASTSALDTKIRDHLFTLISFMLLLTAVAFFLAMRFEKIVSKPLLHLAAVARQISVDHDYSARVEKTSEDEIGILSDGFNDMLEQIQRRQRERDEADQRTREKSQFLANMSHELRTPLNAIIGFSEILRTRMAGRASAKEEKFLDNITTSGQHLLGLVNDILDLSKIEAGKMEVNVEHFAVVPAIEGVCTLMKGISSRRGISFHIDVPSDLPLVEADPVKFKQVLYNLLSNAVKFSPENSLIAIRAQLLDPRTSPLGTDSLEVSVQDQGIGIDPKDHELIFHEFHQVDGRLSRQYEGTGLGLALVRKFMQIHGGAVTVDSAVGEGSTFAFTLPVRYRGVESASHEEHVAAEAPDMRVVVIEDDMEAWRKLETDLRSAGYEPLLARTGEEGIELARSVRPVAVTLDLILPGIDGWEVLRTLKADPRTSEIPVIIASAMENRELGIAFGANDYLTKPVGSVELVQSLKRVGVPPAGTEKTVLVIDDDRTFHDMLDERLAQQGYRIIHAYGTTDGFSRARAELPALVIVDLMMEEMEGFELALKLKSDPATAKLPIVATARNRLSEWDRMRLRGKITTLMQKGQWNGTRVVSVIHDLLRPSDAEIVSGGGA